MGGIKSYIFLFSIIASKFCCCQYFRVYVVRPLFTLQYIIPQCFLLYMLSIYNSKLKRKVAKKKYSCKVNILSFCFLSLVYNSKMWPINKINEDIGPIFFFLVQVCLYLLLLCVVFYFQWQFLFYFVILIQNLFRCISPNFVCANCAFVSGFFFILRDITANTTARNTELTRHQ